MNKSLRLCSLPVLLCIVSAPAFCDTPANASFDADWIKFPALAKHSSQKTLDNFVDFFQHRGFVVVSRQQKFSKAGLVFFHFRAVHPPQDPSPGNIGASVEVSWTPQNYSKSLDFGQELIEQGQTVGL